jgi:hypothetical protein
MKAPAIWPGLKRNGKMSNPRTSLFARLGMVVDVFGSAVAASSAVQGGRVPRTSDLRTLGIDPKAFRSIGKV